MSMVSGSEAKVLHGNAKVDVSMVLVVVCTHPCFVQALEAQHEHRHIGEPWTVVALPHLLLFLFRSSDLELPRLEVMRRRANRTQSMIYSMSALLTGSSVYLRTEKRFVANSLNVILL